MPEKKEPKAVWYLPHHAVLNPRKGKVRVVFDCAATHQGTSLNDQVLPGPDLTNSLLGVLLRFRERRVAISADIEGMFLQVRVPEKDRDRLRFLWWPDGNTKAPPERYRMTSHLFGGTWSPSVSTYALQKTAKDNSQDFNPKLVDTVLRDFYVDDCLKSVDQEVEAIKIARELPRLLQRGGFRLHKWLSNSKAVLQAIPESERASKVQQLNLHALPVERALGVLWDIDSDTFAYDDKRLDRSHTRRGLLSVVSSIYDPMGFLSPFTLKGRLLMQQLARDKVAWDEPLSAEHKQDWEAWKAELVDVSQIHIERCLQPSDFGDIAVTELHHFSDASAVAYGSSSYIRLVSKSGRVKCSLLYARSRVAPLKSVTIPRLELAAATLSVQQDEMLRRELSIQVDSSTFYTDSSIVLAYIKNEKKRFHTYVANRLAIIHAGSTLSQWKHIASEMNPADDLSRGLCMRDLISNERWFKGPAFLSEVTLPDGGEAPEVSLEYDPEVKRAATACCTKPRVTLTDTIIQKYSSWIKLRRVTAWVLRYKDNLLAKMRHQEPAETGRRLTVQELKGAERTLIRAVQQRVYNQEIKDLQTQAKVKRGSRIYKLDPMLSADDTLVCRVRSKGIQIEDDAPGPLILPKEHHLSTLLARHCHEKLEHAGREHTFSELRLRYCIPGARTIVRRLISKCPTCRRLFSQPTKQRMGDLPQERTAVGEPPFTNVGTDCFGPFRTKSGRKINKRYGCIFTCLTSRAVHLEVLDSMDTYSFINALERFISRRGHSRTICCDNGSNFVGAEKELHCAMKEWRQEAIDTFLCKRDIQWKFNPPGRISYGWSMGKAHQVCPPSTELSDGPAGSERRCLEHTYVHGREHH